MSAKDNAKRRKEAAEKGLCTRCCKRVPEPGRKVCPECAEKTRRYKAATQRKRTARLRNLCDFDCFNCKFPDCINGTAPMTRHESEMLEAALGKRPGKKGRIMILKKPDDFDIRIQKNV